VATVVIRHPGHQLPIFGHESDHISYHLQQLRTMLQEEHHAFRSIGSDGDEPLLQQVPSTGSQPLRTLSADGQHDEVIAFAQANNLGHEIELFEKAAALLQGDVRPENIPNITAYEVDALHNETRHKWRQSSTLYFTIFICSLGAIEQGTAQTSMNGANLFFPKQFGIGSDSARDALLVGLINSGIYLSVGIL
jgi:hypothetical protein